jgi:hypothetical protein
MIHEGEGVQSELAVCTEPEYGVRLRRKPLVLKIVALHSTAFAE